MIFGADFSTLGEVERLGGRFFEDGRPADLVECLASHGVSSARLRVWADPYGEDGEPYGGGTNDLPAALRLARRAREAGMEILLDLHYSDFWADPGRQCVPKAWRGMDLAETCAALADYTRAALDAFDRAGIPVESVQIGNEITNGMLWPLGRLTDGSPRGGYDALAALLRAGTEAARESSDARVLLHLERSGNAPLWREWLDAVTERGVAFDEIGASYYPYWHGSLAGMAENLAACAARYLRPVRVVETSYAFTARHYDPGGERTSLCMTTADNACADGSPMPYPATPEGQAAYLRDLARALEALPGGACRGLYWWEPGWLPVPGAGWATPAALRYCGEEGKPTGNEWANQCLFDYGGNALPALRELGR